MTELRTLKENEDIEELKERLRELVDTITDILQNLEDDELRK